VHLSFYNTNEGLGLDRETLKIYINGSRLIGNTYVTQINRTINLTVKDYYNLTMYQGNITINTTFTFLDLGLTFHSWLFGNSNEDYYMISIRKAGGSRWWERGIVPYGEREFLIPSGTYALRIYDRDNTEIYNSHFARKSKYSKFPCLCDIRHEFNRKLLSGQSVIIGDLLELQTELDDATRPDIVKIIFNPPSIYSTFKKEGAILGTILVCPALVVTATTLNETY